MRLVAFEGPDRVGKTTQITLVRNRLSSLGYSVLDYKIPWAGDETSHGIITDFLHSKKVLEYPVIFQAAQMENRLRFQEKVLHTLSCDIVLVDRWSLSSHVYGKAQGVEANFFHPDLDEPDLTLIFEGTSFFKEDQDTMERDTGLQDRVRQIYKSVEGDKIHHIQANRPVNEVTDSISQLIQYSFFR